MSAFRSIFLSWWMLLVALFAIEQAVNINSTVSDAPDNSSFLHSGIETYLSGEYLIRGLSCNGGYDVKTSIPDLAIPHWLKPIEPVRSTQQTVMYPPGDASIFNTLIIIFPFHEFW